MEKGLAKVINDLYGVKFALSPDPEFDDYASNIALQLAKQLGKHRVILRKKLPAHYAVRVSFQKLPLLVRALLICASLVRPLLASSKHLE